MKEFAISAVKAETKKESEGKEMPFKCKDCGHVFEAGQEHSWVERIGSYWGVPCFQTSSDCPVCGGDYDESAECEICGEQAFYNDIIAGVCTCCINKCRKDFEMCLRISEDDTVPVEINTLLYTLFEAKEIEDILKEHIRKKWKEVDCSEYIYNDISWFAERLLEEVKKDENSKI